MTTERNDFLSALREDTITANGARFHYATQGEGPLVVLLHGFPERWFSWKQQITALSSAGYRVVAPDLRGYGASERTIDGYDIKNLALDVASLITALGADTATVIGHDWGGAITWEAASRHPDKISRFAVLNCPHGFVMAKTLLSSPAQLRKSWYMFAFQLPWVPEAIISRDRGAAIAKMFLGMAVDRTRFTPELIEPFRQSVSDPSAVTPMLAYYRTALRSGITRPPPRPAMIEQPGLLLWAEDDQALGLELLAGHVHVARDLRVERIAHCGHFVQQERPEEVNKHLLRWLEQTAPKSDRAVVSES